MANIQTVIRKIEQGFDDCGWEIRNGLGTGHWKGGGSWSKALKPLMEYLAKLEGAKNTEQANQPATKVGKIDITYSDWWSSMDNRVKTHA